MSPLTPTEVRAAIARMFIRRRGAHKSARRRAAAADTAPTMAPNMAAGAPPEGTALAMDPEIMTFAELRTALDELGVSYHHRTGRVKLAALLKEHLDGGLGA
jgi:hypothetical protein